MAAIQYMCASIGRVTGKGGYRPTAHVPLTLPSRPGCHAGDVTQGTIVVVEDEADIAHLIRHNLEGAGYDVQTFVNGSAVLAHAQREQPSLFLLDVMLPGADGFDLFHQIRRTETLAKTPIIFLTAKTDESDRIKGLFNRDP